MRRKIFIIFIISAVLLLNSLSGECQSTFEQPGTGEWSNTSEQKIMGLMQVWAAAKYNFVYFDQVPELDWDGAVKSSIPRILAADDIESYYRNLQELTALLDDGHTFVLPPGAFAGAYDVPPVEFQVIERKFILVRIGETEETKAADLYPGLELTAIDGVPVDDYFEESIKKRRYSGGTKQARESFGLYLLLNGPTNSTVNLTLKDEKENSVTVQLTRNSSSAGFNHRIYDFTTLVEKRVFKNHIVYFRLATFQTDQVVKDFNAEFDGLNLDEVEGMILDVRFNCGGDSDNAFAILSRLIKHPVEAAKWKTRKYLPVYSAWRRPQEWHEGSMGTIQPSRGGNYGGPLIVLIGPHTLSAAEDFIVPLDYSNRALLIGERTGGSTGQPLDVKLPGGGLLMVCAKRDYYPDGREFVGFGIEPDIIVRPRVKDLHEGVDLVIERAIEEIENWANDKSQ